MDVRIRETFSRIDPKFTEREFVDALRSVKPLPADIIINSQKELLKLLQLGDIGELGRITRRWTYNSLPLEDALQDIRRMGESKAERLLLRIQKDPGATPHRPLRIVVRTLPLLFRIQQGFLLEGCAPALNEEMAVAGDSVALFSAWTDVEENAAALWASVSPTELYFDHTLSRKISYLSKKAAVRIAPPNSVFTAPVSEIGSYDEFVSGMTVSGPMAAIAKVSVSSPPLLRLQYSEAKQPRPRVKVGSEEHHWARPWVVEFSRDAAIADLKSLSDDDLAAFVASFTRAITLIDAAPVASAAEARVGWLSADVAFDLAIWVMTCGQSAYEVAVHRPQEFPWEKFDPSHSEEIAALINNELAARDLEEWAVGPSDRESETEGGNRWLTLVERGSDGLSLITVEREREAIESATSRKHDALVFPVSLRRDRKYGYEDPALLLLVQRH